MPDIVLSIREAIDLARAKYGLDDEDVIDLLIEYIENQQDDDALIEHIDVFAAERVAQNKRYRTGCGDPKCPGWGHFEANLYGWEVEACDECREAGLIADDEEALVRHNAACNCGMGQALCAPGTKGVSPEYCYATQREQEFDFARREAIAMRLKSEGRL